MLSEPYLSIPEKKGPRAVSSEIGPRFSGEALSGPQRMVSLFQKMFGAREALSPNARSNKLAIRKISLKKGLHHKFRVWGSSEKA